MTEINAGTTLQELASIVSQALVAGGVAATLLGGAAVSIYTNNRYQSQDLDFVSSAAHQTLAALTALLSPVPAKRTVMLRPRPTYLPHPVRRLTRLPGVIRPNLRRWAGWWTHRVLPAWPAACRGPSSKPPIASMRNDY